MHSLYDFYVTMQVRMSRMFHSEELLETHSGDTVISKINF